MAYPFARLQKDGFWHLVANPDHEIKYTDGFRSMVRLRIGAMPLKETLETLRETGVQRQSEISG